MSTISILPESAPFNAEQRAWLNGFFAGMLGLQGGDGAQLAALQQVALGNIPEASPVAAAEEETFPWHDPALPISERIALAENKPLPRKLMAAMAQLNCGACGYLCQTYSEAIADGSETNLKLCAPGGSETAKLIKLLLKEQPANGTANGHTNGHAAVNGHAAAYSRSNPFAAKLVSSTNLNGEGSEKHTSHVVLDLTGSGLKYEVGDALGVFPRNCPELVDEVLAAVRADVSTQVSFKGEAKLLRELFLTSDLRNVDERHVAWLQSAGNVEHIEPLRTLAEDEDEDQLSAMDLLDLLLRFPVTADLNGLAALMSPLAPRLYSIASSQNAHPDQVHLTVGKATRLVGDRVRKGVASTMFSDRASAGEEVRVFVQPTHGFKLPADKSTPIIMVGPGTGIAPFRAFVQERVAQQATGESWLFFGDQRSATDFLYVEEWEEHLKNGRLTRLDTAFSRDQEEKVYVQTRMREHGAELYRWLERGAFFYVCGDAKRMALDVDRALHDVVAEHGQKSAEEAKAYVAALTKSKRYLRDVY